MPASTLRLGALESEILERVAMFNFQRASVEIEDMLTRGAVEHIAPLFGETIFGVDHLEFARDVLLVAAILKPPVIPILGYTDPPLKVPRTAHELNRTMSQAHSHGRALDLFVPNEDPLIGAAILYELCISRQFSVIKSIVAGLGIYHLDMQFDRYNTVSVIDHAACFEHGIKLYATSPHAFSAIEFPIGSK